MATTSAVLYITKRSKSIPNVFVSGGVIGRRMLSVAAAPQMKSVATEKLTSKERKRKKVALREREAPEYVDYQFIATKEDANEWATEAMHRLRPEINAKRKVFVGIGVAWSDDECVEGETTIQDSTGYIIPVPVQTLHVSLPYQSVGIFHLGAMNVRTSQDFPEALRDLLQLQVLRACAMNIHSVLERLQPLHVNMATRVDLAQLVSVHDQLVSEQTYGQRQHQKSIRSMAVQCERFLGTSRKLHRSGQFPNVDYTTQSLPDDVLLYKATKTKHSRLLANLVTDLVRDAEAEADELLFEEDDFPEIERLAPKRCIDLRIGVMANIWIDGRVVAIGRIDFMGGIHGESRWFEKCMLVSDGQAIVRITTLIHPQTIPPHRDTLISNGVWPDTVTLQSVFQSKHPLIVADEAMLQIRDKIDYGPFVEIIPKE